MCYNVMIGQIMDGVGLVLCFEVIEQLLKFGDEDCNKVLFYLLIGGFDEFCFFWEWWQRFEGVDEFLLLFVMIGLIYGLVFVVDLFVGEGILVVVLQLSWGNYCQVFGLCCGVQMIFVDVYQKFFIDCFEWWFEVIVEVFYELFVGILVVVILNLLLNFGGYMLMVEECLVFVESFFDVVKEWFVVVVCDDVYVGFVYDVEIFFELVFWDFVGKYENLLLIWFVGSIKEFLFFGGCVGFLMLLFVVGIVVVDVFDNKLCGFICFGVGFLVVLLQVVFLQVL